MVFLSGLGSAVEPSPRYREPRADGTQWYERKEYDAKDVAFVLFAGVVMGSALTKMGRAGKDK